MWILKTHLPQYQASVSYLIDTQYIQFIALLILSLVIIKTL